MTFGGAAQPKAAGTFQFNLVVLTISNFLISVMHHVLLCMESR